MKYKQGSAKAQEKAVDGHGRKGERQFYKAAAAKMSKKYYWLKLKENFFNSKEIKKLRHIAGGDTYTVIYLKLMLLSLQDEGKLYFEGIEDNFSDELALELDEDPENVSVTLTYLNKLGLLSVVSETEAFLPRVPEAIGAETDKAEYMRRLREKQKNGNNVTNALPDVTNELPPVTNALPNCYREIEIEIEKDIEKEIDIDINNNIYSPGDPDEAPPKKSPKQPDWASEVVAYLNEKTGKHFKVSSAANVRFISGRANEGYTLADFKSVIDKKTAEWIGTEQEQYLRPETLFTASHFESYLNQRPVKKSSKNQFCNFDQHDYNMEELERRAKIR